MKAELTNSGSTQGKHAHTHSYFRPWTWICACSHMLCVNIRVRLTAQPVDGPLGSDALLLRARCSGYVEQRSQEVNGGRCVQAAT